MTFRAKSTSNRPKILITGMQTYSVRPAFLSKQLSLAVQKTSSEKFLTCEEKKRYLHG